MDNKKKKVNYEKQTNKIIIKHESKVLIIAYGPASNNLSAFHFKQGTLVSKLPKFEIALPPYSADPVLNKQQKLHAKDVVVAIM